jgi:hypothetical protein
MEARNLREQQVEAERLVEASRRRWPPTAPAAAEERAASTRPSPPCESASPGSDHRAIKASIDSFNRRHQRFRRPPHGPEHPRAPWPATRSTNSGSEPIL